MSNQIVVTKDQNELIQTLCNKIESLSNQSIMERNRFTVGLSGGSLIDFLCQGLPNVQTDWAKWIFVLCDERIVAENDKDSTMGQYKARLFPKIKVTDEQLVLIDTELSSTLCAESYSKKLKHLFPNDTLPKIDMLLLGLGPDGHTCSLFPGHKALSESNKWVVGIDDSPKLPPKRITLTFPVINNARTCIFAISGKGKAEVVKKILHDNADFPAGMVKTESGTIWMLDQEAASLLN